MNKMFQDVEIKLDKKYDIDYLFYINDNEDNTELELKKYNYNYVYENIENIKFTDRIHKLAYIRQRLLEKTKKIKSDYVVIFDSDIFFNGTMFDKSLDIIKEKNLFITCLNSIIYALGGFYDWNAYKNASKSDALKLTYNTIVSDKIIKVDEFFNGVVIIKNNDTFKKIFRL